VIFNTEAAIVNPVKGARAPALAPTAVMVSSDLDLQTLATGLGLSATRTLLMSRLYSNVGCPVSLAGPMIGAPYAVMLLENLAVWGVSRVVFLGWCGAVSPAVNTGDLLLVTGGLVDEGTSPHYLDAGKNPVPADPDLTGELRQTLTAAGISFHEGPVWSTDAIFRETPSRLSYFQNLGALGVEMELSALFAVGRFRKIAVASLQVVSDELDKTGWRPGFKTERFKSARNLACERIQSFCRQQTHLRKPRG
jgi:uridine phosphorylase